MGRIFLIFAIPALFAGSFAAQSVFIRINQAGFAKNDVKTAVVISKAPANDRFSVTDASGKIVLVGLPMQLPASEWNGQFPYLYRLDFSSIRLEGNYRISFGDAAISFNVGPYPGYQDDLLAFMRQQRCGYNPYLGVACHRFDGRAFYSPLPDGTFVDASGGWHDAGDQLKYLITASNATARMMLAYELEKTKFADDVDDAGLQRPNGIPDVLDEARWGLEWIQKLHPAPDQLYHQVADDRDHRGFKLPDQDNADYGWGPNSYRPVYFADGKPQGLGQYKSKSTGIANIAGRSAAAMAMAYRIWKSFSQNRGTGQKNSRNYLNSKELSVPSHRGTSVEQTWNKMEQAAVSGSLFAARCLQAAKELYAMGKRQQGFQQGNSFGAPYRYNEITWADDMEWAAAELYRATRESQYLAGAKRYAKLAGTTGWTDYPDSSMGADMSRHYEMYPFLNIGHFALYQVADNKTKEELAGYYRTQLERISARAKRNPYGVGVPFLWCSSNLVVNVVTQILLYERMTGDTRYRKLAVDHRDWLLGKNPWGTSMFEGIPAGGESPEDTHLPTVQILKKQVAGGLVDGPIAIETYRSLRGLTLTKPDEFAAFQPGTVVYHDDVGDYSTNEPTMDGTADATLMMAAWSSVRSPHVSKGSSLPAANSRFTYDHGAITRGNTDRRKLALVFTGDEYAEGAQTIANVLQKRGVKASFFLTGRFFRNVEFRSGIEKLKNDGHYLGPHSDDHLLYADWTDRNKTLVTREEFEKDLNGNYLAMATFGIDRSDANIFLPPYEWYNRTIMDWTSAMGVTLVNFTPGTRSNADYTTLQDKNYIGSDTILDSIKAYEAKDPNGLNGFILLMHIGAGPKRTDKFYNKLDPLIVWLRSKNYEMVRIDELLSNASR
jgi:peptidoglycan/xylan/chitin deacetylase (PgdA/CDA1 family)